MKKVATGSLRKAPPAGGSTCKEFGISSSFATLPATACSLSITSVVYISQAGAAVAVDDTVWTDSGCDTTSFTGSTRFYRIQDTFGTNYAAAINGSGVITNLVAC